MCVECQRLQKGGRGGLLRVDVYLDPVVVRVETCNVFQGVGDGALHGAVMWARRVGHYSRKLQGSPEQRDGRVCVMPRCVNQKQCSLHRIGQTKKRKENKI